MNPKIKIWTGFAILAGGLGLGLAWSPNAESTSLYAQQPLAAQSNADSAVVGAERLSDAFRSAASKLEQSVVTITSIEQQVQRIQMRRGGGVPRQFRGIFPEDLLNELGRDEFDDRDEYRRERESGPTRRMQTGVGSGVIVSGSGYILTNNHVVAEADELQVELADGRTYKAELVGTDEKSDVAVLKIDATNLRAAQLGNSSQMQVGDWVIAVGSPFGLNQTVTAGIISATNRSFGILNNPSKEGYEDFLQTDAAINPGNSGGPLVNLRGEVIGINTAINSRTGTNAGVGFAIPINMAARIMEDLRDRGRVVRGYVGIHIRDLGFETAKELNLPEGVVRGAFVASVQEDEPAERALLKADDVITAVNGVSIRSSEQFRNVVALSRPGSTLDLQGYRGRKPVRFQVVVGELTEEKLDEFRYAGMSEIDGLGLRVMEVNPRVARILGVPEGTQGIVVTVVDQRGQGYRLGLRPEDLVLEVNGQKIQNAQEFEDAVLETERDLRMIVSRRNTLLMLQATAP